MTNHPPEHIESCLHCNPNEPSPPPTAGPPESRESHKGQGLPHGASENETDIELMIYSLAKATGTATPRPDLDAKLKTLAIEDSSQ